MSHKTSEADCPKCNAILDFAQSKHKPRPGDFVVCPYCITKLGFDDGLRCYVLGKSEYTALSGATRFQIDITVEYMKRYPRPAPTYRNTTKP